MHCFTTRRDGITVMQLGGDLDAAGAAELRRLLGWALVPGARVIVDVADVGRVDTVAVGILLAAQRRADIARARMLFATPDTRVALALHDTIPPGRLRSVESVAAALAVLTAGDSAVVADRKDALDLVGL